MINSNNKVTRQLLCLPHDPKSYLTVGGSSTSILLSSIFTVVALNFAQIPPRGFAAHTAPRGRVSPASSSPRHVWAKRSIRTRVGNKNTLGFVAESGAWKTPLKELHFRLPCVPLSRGARQVTKWPPGHFLFPGVNTKWPPLVRVEPAHPKIQENSGKFTWERNCVYPYLSKQWPSS